MENKCVSCVHYDACKTISDVHGLTFGSATFCNNFKDKSLFVELPCKVGDVVYYFSHRPFNLSILPNTIYEANVERIVTTRLGTSIVIQIHNKYGCTEIAEVSSFGKTVFLTKEEAEQKLKELKE